MLAPIHLIGSMHMAKVLVPLATGCEELEAVTVIDLLRRAGIEVVSAGLGARGEAVRASRGTVLIPDSSLDEALAQEYDMVVLPGGLRGAARARRRRPIAGPPRHELPRLAHRRAARRGALRGDERGARRKDHHLARARRRQGLRAHLDRAPRWKTKARRSGTRLGETSALIHLFGWCFLSRVCCLLCFVASLVVFWC